MRVDWDRRGCSRFGRARAQRFVTASFVAAFFACGGTGRSDTRGSLGDTAVPVVSGGMAVSKTAGGILLANADSVPLYFAVYETDALPLIEWAPCTDPITCERVLPGGRHEVTLSVRSSDTVMVFWWKLLATGEGYRADSVRAVPVKMR